MKASDPSMNNLFLPPPVRRAGLVNDAMDDELEKVKLESMDHVLWTMKQGVALAKLKVFSTLAKSVNDQQ